MNASTENQSKPRVAVIGIGTMGAAMTRRLLAGGFEVGVWSRHGQTTVPMLEVGATAFDHATGAVRDADVVISMLATEGATAQVMLGDGVLPAMRPGAVWVQMATIGVETTDWLAAQTHGRRPDVDFVDAPVSGSRGPAEQGQLLILASGPHRAAETLAPVFDALGRATMWLGPAGAGSRIKLVLNTWLAFQTEGAAEAAALADQLGVPSAALFEALRDNPLASPYALAKLARMEERDYGADFSLDWALKDLDLVASAAGGGAAPIARAIADRWRDLVQDGASGLDVSAAREGLEPAGRSRSVTPAAS
jgi:3-hydroxyisobutyrate dehydrogenase